MFDFFHLHCIHISYPRLCCFASLWAYLHLWIHMVFSSLLQNNRTQHNTCINQILANRKHHLQVKQEEIRTKRQLLNRKIVTWNVTADVVSTN